MRYYGDRIGISRPRREIPTLCIAEVSEPPHHIHKHQCSFKRKTGPDGLYCKKHAKMLEDGRHVYVGTVRS